MKASYFNASVYVTLDAGAAGVIVGQPFDTVKVCSLYILFFLLFGFFGDTFWRMETYWRWSSDTELYWNGFLYFNIIIYLLKLYLPLVHEKAFGNKFQLNHKITYKSNISLHIKQAQSKSQKFLILFWIQINCWRLFHMREPRKWIAFLP